jgi:DNA-binding beta-propeller fold protein YncE
VNVGGAPDAPDWQAVGYNAVWVANSVLGTVQRIDPRTNRVADVHDSITQPCAGLAAGFGSIWSADCSTGEIDRIDPRTLHVVAHVEAMPADSEGLIASDANGVWIVVQDLTTDDTRLERINPHTNRIAARIRVPAGSVAATTGFGAVWVTTPDSGTVERADPRTGKVVATIKVHDGPRFLAAGEGAVWVLNQSDGSVSKIDPRANRVVATIAVDVPGSGGIIVVGLGSVWISMPGTPLVRIDPRTDRVTERYTGPGGDAIITGFGSVWLSNHEFGTVWRIRP